MPPTDDPDTNGWLTIQEAADVLKVSVSTLRRWDKDGHLVAGRTPGPKPLYRYHRADLDAALRGEKASA